MVTDEKERPALTADDLAEASRGFEGSVELVRGRVVEHSVPKPPCGTLVGNVAAALSSWSLSAAAGVVSVRDGILVATRPDTVRVPCVLFTPYDRLPDRKAPSEWYVVPPSVCVEVISDNERWSDVERKTNEYLAFGVDEVWLVEQDLRTLTVVRGDGMRRTVRGEEPVESPALPEFSVKLTDFFWNC